MCVVACRCRTWSLLKSLLNFALPFVYKPRYIFCYLHAFKMLQTCCQWRQFAELKHRVWRWMSRSYKPQESQLYLMNILLSHIVALARVVNSTSLWRFGIGRKGLFYFRLTPYYEITCSLKPCKWDIFLIQLKYS